MKKSKFRKGLEALINGCSKEQGSNTPDYILAEYLNDCLVAFDKATKQRGLWYGRQVTLDGPALVETKAEG